MLAIVEAYRAGLLQPKHWGPNILSGLVVGVLSIPLAMAFAIASGATPAQGLYTAIVAGFVVGIFGGSRVQISGPTGAFVVILAGITAEYGYDGLQIATLMAGIMLLMMGLARLGAVIKFIPESVIIGFTTGIGVIIFVEQCKDFFGLKVTMALNTPFYQKIMFLIEALPTLNFATMGLGILSLVLVVLTHKITNRIPGALIALTVTTVLQSIFQFEGVATLGSAFGGISQVLPSFHIPYVSLDKFFELLGPAFTIALLGAIESLLSASVADGMTNTRHYSNQELIGQGIANVLCPLFGGFASTGAIARTATNVRNGATSPVSAIVHTIVLIALLLVFAPWASYIPLCALSAVLFIIAYNMANIPYFLHILRHAPQADMIVLAATFLFTVLTGLIIGVNVGVILSMLFFIRNMSQSVKIEAQHDGYLAKELNIKNFAMPKNTLVYAITGPFFFGAAKNIECVVSGSHKEFKAIVFRLKDVPFIDMTGLETFKELLRKFHQRNVEVYLCEANEVVCKKLKSMHVSEFIVSKQPFDSLHDVLKVLKKD